MFIGQNKRNSVGSIISYLYFVQIQSRVIMALKIIDHGSTEYQQMVKMRDDILRKPLGLGFSPQELEKEKDNMLIAAFEDDQLLGCCMLVEENPATVRLRQMAVLNDLQGK